MSSTGFTYAATPSPVLSLDTLLPEGRGHYDQGGSSRGRCCAYRYLPTRCSVVTCSTATRCSVLVYSMPACLLRDAPY
eukprot:2914287-Rhodomonas_salina.3